MDAIKPATIEDVQAAVGENSRLSLRGGGTKPALSALQPGSAPLDTGGLSGILEYQPDEYTFTAMAGTPLQQINQMLEGNAQYLPFDPPLARSGATLGGTVAAGLSGSGRYRYGGVRDFLIGVRFVDGHGNLVRGGGKVVKNAAGFDLPKLMVGSLGRYGVMVELSFKVFPRPPAAVTLVFHCVDIQEALQLQTTLARSPLEIHALDLAPGKQGVDLVVRLGGREHGFAARIERLCKLLGRQADKQMFGDEEATYWEALGEFGWLPPGCALVKVPLTPLRLPALESALSGQDAGRRYACAANLAWVAWPGPLSGLDGLLENQSLSGVVLSGPTGRVHLGVRIGDEFARRALQALDPQRKFGGLDAA